MKIYDKNTVRRKNFKTLLAEDPDDVEYYNSLRKRDADKVLMNRQARGWGFCCFKQMHGILLLMLLLNYM